MYAGTRQDGDLQHGFARSFTDNGDGTITDNATGLMWEKLDDNNNYGDTNNLNGIHDIGTPYLWAGAFTKVNTLNSLNFAGYNDWRLPNVMELQSLVNFGGSLTGYPAFNSNCTPGCTVATCSCNFGYFWSSTSNAGLPTLAWVVLVGEGITHSFTKTSYEYITFARAVRGPS